MTDRKRSSNPVALFFGGLLMAVGGLIGALGGLCSLGMIGLTVVGAFSSSGGSGSQMEKWSSALEALVPILGICAVQIGFGVGVFLLGRSVYRGGQT
jgi:hypothetical protein